MGEHDVKEETGGEPHRQFVKRLLDDLYALQKMLDEGLFESGVHRIGGEQELFLVDAGGRPVGESLEVLEIAADEHFTTELGRFQLEINLDPFPFEGDCLSRMQRHLETLLDKLRAAARERGADLALIGILPTLRKTDMGLDNMTPIPRYHALNRAANQLRGGPFQFRIKGVDELQLTHDSVMLEACNSSFQVHLQVGPEEFTRLYNAAQLFAAPTLAAATNSPILFGQRLWQETRIALFPQAADTRSARTNDREQRPRVHFGRRWLTDSVIDIFKEDISRFRTIFSADLDEDPFETLKQGGLPELKALRLHNGTIWRWNRPCFGITNGRAHLRIENRVLPSGPTVVDEIANAAFWLGLMAHAKAEGGDVADTTDFDTVKENFVMAARQGLAAQFTWQGGKTIPADRLVGEMLVPKAREGLKSAGIAGEDADRYLGVIADRVRTGRTGSKWVLQSLASMRDKVSQGTVHERLSALTRATIARQTEGRPAHEWPLAELTESGGWKRHYTRVEQYMTTDLFTVNAEDSLDLVANVMAWQHIRHVPVEDEAHRLVGVVSYRTLLRELAKGERGRETISMAVSSVMKRDPVCVTPETSTIDAIELMRKNGVSCLPVVREDRLVGIVTDRDFMIITRELLLQKLKEQD